MSGFEIIILIVVVIAIAAAIGAFLTRGQKSLKELTKDYYNNEEAQEVVDLAKELYNKDLRPVVEKKAPKKEKVTEQVESMKKVVEAHDSLVKEIEKVAPEPTEVKTEAVVETTKPKKNRKYYPKKPKTNI